MDATELNQEDLQTKIELPEDAALIEIVEPKKPNRHERRKREKLARMLAKKEELELRNRKKVE